MAGGTAAFTNQPILFFSKISLAQPVYTMTLPPMAYFVKVWSLARLPNNNYSLYTFQK
jgi:hypothetical protein